MLLARADRIFQNFLDIQDRRIDNEGNSAWQRRGVLSTIRRHKHARQQAADDSFELFSTDRENGAFDGTFFEWLMSHMDEIFSLIIKIISLFGI